jgi:hypothetical protein
MGVTRRLLPFFLLMLVAVRAHAQGGGPLPIVESGSLTSTTCPGSGCLEVDVNGQGAAGLQITNTWVGTIKVLASTDCDVYDSTPIKLFDPAASSASTVTGNGVWFFSVSGLCKIRVTAEAAFASGTADVTVRALPITAANGASSGGGGGGTVDQGAAGVDPWLVEVTNATLAVTGNWLTDAQLRATPIDVNLAASAIAVPVIGASPFTTSILDASTFDSAAVRGAAPSSGENGLVVRNIPSGTQDVSAAALPLPAGAATSAKQDTGNTSLASIDTKLTNPLPVSGTVTAVQPTGTNLHVVVDSAPTTAVTGPLTDAQLRASAVPISAAALPLPSGAATSAKQDTGNTSLASIDTKLTNPLPVSGTVSATPVAMTQSGTITSNSNPNDRVTLTCTSVCASASMEFVATGSPAGFLTFEVSTSSGTNYFPLEGVNPYRAGSQPIAPSVDFDVSTTTSGLWRFPLPAGTTNVRVRANSWTSGSWAIKLDASSLPAQILQSVGVSLVTAPTSPANQAIVANHALYISQMSPQNGSAQADVVTQTDAATQPNYVPYDWSLPMLYNGATWDRWRGDTTNGAFVNVKNTTLAVTQSGAWSSVGVTGTFWPTTAGSPGSTRLSDGAGFYDARSIRALTSADTVTAVQATGTNLHVVCDSGCTSAAAFADNAAFTPNTTGVMPVAAEVDDTGTSAATENSAAALRMSTRRELYTQIRDAAGNERGANVTAANALKVDGSGVTQPVSGSFLTDTQLRASAVPISAAALPLPSGAATGTKQDTGNTSLASIDTKLSGNLTVTQGTPLNLRAYVVQGDQGNIATPWYQAIVDGNGASFAATVHGASTAPTASDSSLVTALSPVGNTVSTKTVLTTSGPTSATIGTSAATAVSGNANRKGLVLTNLSNARICLAFNTTAVINTGICLDPGAIFNMNEYMFTTVQINAIASAASSVLAIQEFLQ